MLSKENELLFELCKFNSIEKDRIKELLNFDLDYTYLLGKILMNRIGGVAFYSLKSMDDIETIKKLDREFLNSLKSIYEYNCIKTKAYLQNVEYVCSILNGNGIKYSVLKGAFLASIYPMGLRTSNDIDILLNEHDISKCSVALKNNGFFQGYVNNEVFKPATRKEIISSKINRGETVPFVKEKDGVFIEVDLNFSLDSTPDKSNLIEKIFYDFNVIENIKTPVLNIEDFFIHLCMHLYKEATGLFWVKKSSDLLLYKYVDIYFVFIRFFNSNDINNLLNRIMELGLCKECYYVLYSTNLIFNLKNINLTNLILKIKPDNSNFLNEIYDIENGKTYKYDINFIDWFFCSSKETYLYEVQNDE